jgi:hypothetical protein
MRESFLDTLPEVRWAPTPTLTPADRVAQFEALVRWQAVNAVRLDDLCDTLDKRVREAEAMITGAMVAWQMLIEAGLLPDRPQQAQVVALRVAE